MDVECTACSQNLYHPIPNPHVENSRNREEVRALYFGLTPEEIAEKILYKNVDDFLQCYYHDAYPKHGQMANVLA